MSTTPFIPIPPLRPQTGPLSRSTGAASLIQFQQTGISKVDSVLMDAQAQIGNLVDQIQSVVDLTNLPIQVPVFLGGANHQPGLVPDPSGAPTGSYLDATGKFSVPRLTPVAFSTLPAASAGNEGTLASVKDSNTNTWGATVAGGGTNHVLAWSNGSSWTVIGV